MDKNKLFNKYQHLVRQTIIRQFPNYKIIAKLAHLEVEDLEQIGYESLWKCIGNYEKHKHRFTTYAIGSIRGSIGSFIKRKGSVLHFAATESNDVISTVKLVGYNSTATKDGNLTFEEVIPSRNNTEDATINKMAYKNLISGLRPEDLYIIEQKSCGVTGTSIAKELNLSKQAISNRYKAILDKIRINYTRYRMDEAYD